MPKNNVIKKTPLVPTVLISGGAGFIGSYLVRSLLDKNARVVVVDNFKTGKDIYVKEYLADKNFALFDADLNEQLPSEIESVDYIFHLAGLEEYLFSKQFLNLESLLTNSLGTKNLLDLAKKSQSKFLLVSTIDVYLGKMSQLSLDDYFGHTLAEESKFSIAEAKRFAEALVWEYRKKHDTDVRIVRVPEIFGPRMNLESSGNLGVFIKNIIEGRDLEVYGDGTEEENYLYIDDAISGLLKAMFNEDTKGNIYSLSSGNPITTLELAYILKDMADGTLEVKFKTLNNDIRSTSHLVDTSNLGGLSWRIKVPLKEGIKKTLEWFGYSPNTNSFKPAKLIDNKADNKKAALLSSTSKTQYKDIENNVKSNIESNIEDTTLNTDSKSIVGISLEPSLYKNNFDYKSMDDNEKDFGTKTELFSLAGIKDTSIKNIKNSKNDNDIKNNNNNKNENLNEYIVKESLPRKFVNVINPFSLFRFVSLGKLGKLSVFNRSRGNTLSKSNIDVVKRNSIFIPPYILSIGAVLLSALFVFVILPGVVTLFNIKAGVDTLRSISDVSNLVSSEDMLNKSTKASKNFDTAKRTFLRLGFIYKAFGQQDKFYSLSKSLSSISSFSKALQEISSAGEPFTNFWKYFRPDSNGSLSIEDIERSKLKISTAKSYLEMASADFMYVDLKYLPNKYQKDVKVYKEYLEKSQKVLGDSQIVLSEFPDIIGLNGEKRYLILFQNNNELRPTGGFIGSYGIVEMENGKLTNLLIDDIYNPDGQIDVRRIDVVPPAPISEALNEDVLYLRNSNWNPDFTKAVLDFENLYYKVNGVKFDGYVSIDLDFVKRLLEVTGPVFLATYNEEINAENLYERAQFHSSYDYQNGSDQKRSFLTILGSKLLEKLFSMNTSSLNDMGLMLIDSLDQRHLQLYFASSNLNLLLSQRHWDGGLVDWDNDYLFVVNSNLGGTKSNYYVKSNYRYEVNSMTRDGLLRANLYLDYNHTGTDNSWPGGPYRNYVRILTQDKTKLTGAKIINNSEEIDIFDKIVVSKVDKYNSFEYFLTVEPTQKVTLVLSYDLPPDLSITKDHLDYSLYWQKQSGTSSDGYEFLFSPPFGTEITSYSQGMEFMENRVLGKGSLIKDISYSVKLR